MTFGRDPILPLDSILQPSRRYDGEDYVPTMLQRLHRAFVHAKDNMADARERIKEIYDRKARKQEYSVGDPVHFFDQAQDTCKLSTSWQPFF